MALVHRLWPAAVLAAVAVLVNGSGPASAGENGSLWCWGENGLAQLGLGDRVDRFIPTRVGTDNDWLRVDGGTGNTCGVREDHTLWCWGWNVYGQLGIG